MRRIEITEGRSDGCCSNIGGWQVKKQRWTAEKLPKNIAARELFVEALLHLCVSYLDVLHGYKKMPQTWVIHNDYRCIIYIILKAGKSKIKELASEKRLHDTLSCGRKQKEKR